MKATLNASDPPSIRRQLAGAAVALTLAATGLGGLAHAAHATTYGSPGTPNGGLVLLIGQGCVGLELWGVPGFFGSLTDPGECDL